MIILKTTQEIELMQENGRILSKIHSRVKHQAKPGVSTQELADYALEEMESHKCRSAFIGYKGFPGAICISLNEEIVHGIPSTTRYLQPGDLVKLDMGIVRNNFYADMAETFYLGEDEPENIKDLLCTTRKALEAGMRNTYAGNTLGKVSQAIQDVIESAQMAVVRRFVGHGIGRSLHEKPPVPNFVTQNEGPRLEVGMVLALEPIATYGDSEVLIQDDGWTAVTKQGELSAHFEHTVAITSAGPRILTTCQAG